MLRNPLAGSINPASLQCNEGLRSTSGVVTSKASGTAAASAYVFAAEGIVLEAAGTNKRTSLAYAATVAAAQACQISELCEFA